MKRSILAVAVVVALADGTPAKAQFVLGPVGPPAFGGGFGFGRGAGFSYHRHHLHVYGFAGGYYSRSVFVSPFAPAFPVAPVGPFGFGSGVFSPGWGFGPPLGWNPAWGGAVGWFGQPLVVPGVFPPFALGPNDADLGRDVPNGVAGPAAPPQRAELAPVGAKPGDFLVIAPKKDFPPPGVIAPDVARVAVAPARPAFRFDPFAKPAAANVEKRDADPVKEAARLMKLGRGAFATGEYGKAGEQFERAAVANPKAAEPHFLKAQAAFAAGGYADAVAAVRAGLALDPAWPAGTFDPKEPYGANAGEFAAHLATLRKAVAANPGEPTLEFLLGYQLWFVGEKAEANKWFAAAAKTLPAPGPIALFK